MPSPPIAVRVLGPASSRDLSVSVSDPDATIADLMAAVGSGPDQGLWAVATAVGPTPLAPTDSVIASLAPGSLVGPARLLGAPGSGPDEPHRLRTETVDREQAPAVRSTQASQSRSDRAGPSPTSIDVSVVAGPASGATARLAPGLYRCGPAGEWYLAVNPDGPNPGPGDPTGNTGIGNNNNSGGVGTANRSEPWSDRGRMTEIVATVHGALAIGPAVDSQPGPGAYVHRPARPASPARVDPILLDPAPPPVKAPPPLSLITLVAPIPIAVLMAIMFRPLFAVFAAMGPIMALGRWAEGRRRFRRETRTRAGQVARLARDLAKARSSYAEATARLRWHNHPHVAELWRRARHGSVRLWERRPGQAGYLHLTVGVGPDRCSPDLGDTKLDAEVYRSATAPLEIRPVPHVVDLGSTTGIGLHGHRPTGLALARSLVLQAATLHGPADLRIGLLSRAEPDEWDWLKWLPHLDPNLVSDHHRPLVARFAQFAPPPGARPPAGSEPDIGKVHLLVVDDPHADVAAIHRAARDAGATVRFIALADSPTLLPAACPTLAEAGPHLSTLTSLAEPAKAVTAIPVGIDAHAADSWARALAPMRDPEVIDTHTGHDGPVSLIGVAGGSDPERIAQRWAGADPQAHPRAGVGIGEAGRVVLDLVSDGPHALIAGTTGAGKSEFLRTLIMALAVDQPPSRLNLVLVDFKGGGALDVCDRLPHVAGLITDLDETLVARAVRSLRSELVSREHRFRELGASDYDQAVGRSPVPIPRVVIVIDEFAALATDHPDLMGSIIDLAARGRSLGMHLVLATQRPSGVVSQKIRANTNLRIALRVQDVADSQDVIGSPQAATIDRREPGRALIRIASEPAIAVQTAYGALPDRRAQPCVLTSFHLFDTDEANGDGGDTPARTEIQAMLEAIIAAAKPYPAPVPLWNPPLPDRLDWIDLGTRVISERAALVGTDGPAGVALGLVDDAERRTQLPWRWDPATGGLAIFGASADDAARAIVSLVCGLAEGDPGEPTDVYVVDAGGGRLASLESLDTVGAYIRGDERDRLDRVLALFEAELAERSRPCDDRRGGRPGRTRLILAVENLAGLLDGIDDLETGAIVGRLAALVRDGPSLGVHMVVSARAVRDMPHRLAQQVSNRLCLRLADVNGYLSLGLSNRDIVDLGAMRALDLADARSVQLVEPPDIETSLRSVDSNRAGPRPVGEFPDRVASSDLPGARIDGPVLRIPIGISSVDLGIAELGLGPRDHALVVGPPGSGRTMTLATIADRLVSRAGLSIAVVSPPRATVMNGPLERLSESVRSVPVAISTLDQLDVWLDAAGPGPDGADWPQVVLVDDAERLAPALAERLGELSSTADGVRIIATTTPEEARSVRSWTAPIRGRGIGILLGPNPGDGDVFRVRRPKVAGLGQIPGRGHLVNRSIAGAIQVGEARPETNYTNAAPPTPIGDSG